MFITVDNVNFYVKSRGCGKPLICLHGFAEDHTTWDALEVTGHRLILIDLIGHGQSDKPINGALYKMDEVIRQIHEVVQVLDLKTYSLLGYSLGGRIALKYATVYGNEIDKLILESASYGICDQKSRHERRICDTKLAVELLRNGMDWFVSYWSDLPIFESQRLLSMEKRIQVQERRRNNKAYALANTLMGTGQGIYRSLKNDVRRIDRPILYISGALDDKYCRIGFEMKSLGQDVTHAIIPCVGHNTHVERLDVFIRTVDIFVSRSYE